ncbi:hypothetical protein [Clostridium sp.]|uniref:hypothetical protein n=1 Tax=Clostridium sp. TaxID=1506 RepID=UPI003217F6EC
MDCNNCKNININEFEQKDNTVNHICNIYNTKCFHNIVSIFSRGTHNSKIYPCLKCEEDKYKNYKPR